MGLAAAVTLDSKVLSYLSRRSFFGALVIAGTVAISACGSSGDQASGTQTPAPAEAQADESVPMTYTDARFHYRIDAPGGRMTSNSDGTASYIGPSERLEVSIIQGSQAANPASLASQDLSSVSSSAAGFHQLASPAVVKLNGRTVTRFSYTWNAGTSQVTGKAIALTTVRYYVPKDSGTLAVITYGVVSNQFDPQGADDIVLTFQWL